MYKFIERLNVAREFGLGVRLLEHLNYSFGIVSIQASKGHYCVPKELLPLDQYESFEMLVEFKSNDIVEGFDKKQELNQHECGESLYAHVPAALIEEFIDYLDDREKQSR